MWRALLKAITVLALFLVLVGCKEAGGDKKGEAISVGMVTDVGGVNDQSFNQSAWEGLLRAKQQIGVDVTYIESNQTADYSANMETLHDNGTDLIWGIGFLMADDVLNEAKANTEQKYGIIDSAYDDVPENLICVVFKEQEPSFLVGYIAGKMTKTNKVGFVGGVKFALIEKFEYGFKAGVQLANPDVEVITQYAESFTDAAKGKAIANSMYQDGADIIFHASGSVGDGVIEAAKEQGKWVIGVDKDQNFLAPDNVLTSAMKRVDNAIYNVVEDYKKGNWNGGNVVVYGLAEGGVGIAPTSDKHVPEDILKEVTELEKKIIAGEVKVPYDLATYEAY